MTRDRRAIGFVLSLGFLAFGCATAKHAGEKVLYGVNPFATTDVLVLGVSQHGPYLLVSLAGPMADLRFFAPATQACMQVLAPDARVNYGKSGQFGRFRRDDQICDPIGVASLAAWRDTQPRRRGPPVPRAAAYYHVVQQDPELIFLRGRFPLASRVFISGGYDIVAVLPNVAACASVAEQDAASLEFRAAGPAAFRLLAGNQACDVLGFSLPLEVPTS
ncbi:MAG: hypothetical protein NTZ61_10500 [Proteobacteria bacterium]|nr:hypothetical protein [Pseudomonadota bacterium]